MLNKVKNFIKQQKEKITPRLRYKLIDREEYHLLRKLQEEHEYLQKEYKKLKLKYDGQNSSFYNQLNQLTTTVAENKVARNDIDRYKQDREDFRRRLEDKNNCLDQIKNIVDTKQTMTKKLEQIKNIIEGKYVPRKEKANEW